MPKVSYRILYGKTLDEMRFTPRKSSWRWGKYIGPDPKNFSDDKVAEVFYPLHGAGCYEFRGFFGYKRLERWPIWIIYGRSGKYIDYRIEDSLQ